MTFRSIRLLPGFRCLAIGLPLLALVGLGTALHSADKKTAPRAVTAKDLPRIPPTEPADALKTFQLARGCRLELVAAEPLVADPVDACFDAQGRMYVAEMHGYPFSQEPTRLNPRGGGKKDAGIIRLLEDTDGDGKMDRSTVFADKLSWPTSVCCYNGGLFVLAPRFLYYFKDRDGDGRADLREVVLEGFGRDNVQSLANNLKWGLDHHIYFAAGRNPKRLRHRGKPLKLPQGADLRFDPRTEKFQAVTGGLQFGHSFDDWGNRFVCSNSNHIQQVVYPRRYLARNPFLAVSGLVRSIATDGASARVFRTSPPEPWRIIRQKWRAAAKGYRLVINKDGAWEFLPLDPSKKKGVVPTEYPVGFFTSATGVTIYRGGAYPLAYQANAFVGDVGGNLVHRKTLKSQGVLFAATRADAGEEFIRSSDNWFRPVNFVNAPDGSLYVLDMYRETVEHPYSIPAEIKKFLHLQSGSDRGRIYRIVVPGMKPARPRSLAGMDGAELADQLQSAHAWQRETAQRLLWERQDRSAVPTLLRLAKSASRPQTRVHALYALAGLKALPPSLLTHALQDAHPRVREHAIRLSESRLKQQPFLVAALARLTKDSDPRVRFQLAFSLGEADGEAALQAIADLARTSGDNREIRTALLTSVAGTADRLAEKLIDDKRFLKTGHAGTLLSDLCLVVGANPDPRPALRVLAAAARPVVSPAVQQGLLTALGEGLSRRGASIEQLLKQPSASATIRKQVAALFDRATRQAADEKLPLSRRAAAIGLLTFADLPTAQKHLAPFLSPRVPTALQRAAVAALAGQKSDQPAGVLLKGWRRYSPQLRRDVVDALMSSPGRIRQLLAAVEAGTVRRGDLDRDKKQRMTNHPNRDVRQRSRKLLGGAHNADRARVVAAHQSVLKLEGDRQRGLQVFKKNCAVCHRVGGVGHQVAPDLASVKNKSSADLLIAILDPNREAQPNFNTYNVVTEGGRVLNGIIAAETANSITLRRAENKQDVVLRSNIASLRATGVSLMPEGLEKDLSHQNLADVIAFVRSIQAPPPKKKP